MQKKGKEFWVPHVEKFHRSGLQLKAYAKQQGVCAKQLSAWKVKLASQTNVGNISPGSVFVPIEVTGAQSSLSRCTLVVRGKIHLELEDLPSTAWLAQLAREVE